MEGACESETQHGSLATLSDGKLAADFGPIFGNGTRNGAYKMDLGAVKCVSAITSWSHNMMGFRGKQKRVLYGNAATDDPGWDLSKYVPPGTIDTTGRAKAPYTAASLKGSADKPLGKFRWVVWAVSPVTKNGGGENTAYQELFIETTR